MQSNFLFVAVFVCLFSACNRNNIRSGKVVARVYDNYLYADDLKDCVPRGVKSQDSLVLVKKYISHWMTEALILHKAEQNLTKEQKDVSKQLKDYQNSLITYIYEKELIRQKLDTIIHKEEIETYYTNHKNNFELKDNIIKVVYVKVNKKVPQLEKLKNWYKSEVSKDKIALENYCHQYAENFFLDDSTWLLFDDLLKEIPIQASYNKELFLQNNRFIEVSDANYLYFVNIKGFQIKNSISPLAFEVENIKNIILNKRKLELITKMKEEVEKEARSGGEIEETIKLEK